MDVFFHIFPFQYIHKSIVLSHFFCEYRIFVGLGCLNPSSCAKTPLVQPSLYVIFGQIYGKIIDFDYWSLDLVGKIIYGKIIGFDWPKMIYNPWKNLWQILVQIHPVISEASHCGSLRRRTKTAAWGGRFKALEEPMTGPQRLGPNMNRFNTKPGGSLGCI